MSAMVVRGDAARVPLPDASVDLVVTSPPYFSLRSYTDGGEHYDGQIGSEAAPQEYVAALLACTREWMRVLKPSGSLFVNLGDKYNSAASGQNGLGASSLGAAKGAGSRMAAVSYAERMASARGRASDAAQPKSLLGLPWRYALGCVDDLGLILRAEIVWAKPNGLPESVTDRVRRSHEQVFHFTRQPRYFSAVDEVRESYTPAPRGKHDFGSINGHKASVVVAPGDDRTQRNDTLVRRPPPNPLGKLPGSVWEIPSQPLTVPAHLGIDHFAAFPMELPRRIILGWSPPGICVACGEGRRPVVDVGETSWARRRAAGDPVRYGPEAVPRRNGHSFADAQDRAAGGLGKVADRTITGYACACLDATAPTRPALVLDPFGGTGTTALVAAMHGRLGLSLDRSADYCRLARWRVRDPAERARALGVAKPPPVLEGQGALFGDVAL